MEIKPEKKITKHVKIASYILGAVLVLLTIQVMRTNSHLLRFGAILAILWAYLILKLRARSNWARLAILFVVACCIPSILLVFYQMIVTHSESVVTNNSDVTYLLLLVINIVAVCFLFTRSSCEWFGSKLLNYKIVLGLGLALGVYPAFNLMTLIIAPVELYTEYVIASKNFYCRDDMLMHIRDRDPRFPDTPSKCKIYMENIVNNCSATLLPSPPQHRSISVEAKRAYVINLRKCADQSLDRGIGLKGRNNPRSSKSL